MRSSRVGRPLTLSPSWSSSLPAAPSPVTSDSRCTLTRVFVCIGVGGGDGFCCPFRVWRLWVLEREVGRPTYSEIMLQVPIVKMFLVKIFSDEDVACSAHAKVIRPACLFAFDATAMFRYRFDFDRPLFFKSSNQSDGHAICWKFIKYDLVDWSVGKLRGT